jgi:hypothetical protein
MRLRLYSTSLFFLFLAFVAMSNRNGRASSQNSGNTGAPGDEMIAGAPRTCVNCHGGTNISADLLITLLNAAGNVVTEYTPGADYTARVTINASGTGLSGYGFQMIALRDNGNVDIKGFSDPNNTNNYKLGTISNGRTYAEHANISTPNTFDVAWKAPVAGTGDVTFYASGNGVNRNNGSSGDGADNGVLKVKEAQPTSVSNTMYQYPRNFVNVYPNPIFGRAVVQIEVINAGTWQAVLCDMAGKPIWSGQFDVKPGSNDFPFAPAADLSSGIYLLHLTNGQGGVLTTKMIKS